MAATVEVVGDQPQRPPRRRTSRATSISSLPPGFHFLATNDTMVLHRAITSSCYTAYYVKGDDGQTFCYSEDQASCGLRCLLCPLELFGVVISGTDEPDAMRISKPLSCWCLPCFKPNIRIEAPIGSTVGFVSRLSSFSGKFFGVLDEERNLVFKINGAARGRHLSRLLPHSGDLDFAILSADDDRQIGSFSDAWKDPVSKCFPLKRHFSLKLQSEENIDLKHKLLLFAVLFVIEDVYFDIRK